MRSPPGCWRLESDVLDGDEPRCALRGWAIVSLIAFLGGSGCATLGTVQTADTVGRHRFETALEPGVLGGFGRNGETTFIPYLNVAARYGLNDSFDIGGRAGSSGIELTTKWRLTRPAPAPRPIVSVAPSVGATAGGDSGGAAQGSIFFQLPVLIGIPTANGSQFVLGPKLHDWLFIGADHGTRGAVNVLSVGSSVGYAVKFSDSFRLLPEVAILFPVSGSVTGLGSTSGVTIGSRSVLFQATLGLLFTGWPGS
jgi:hypothetical protein